jgi:GNAT superfamily N-acetyltransferase
VAPTTPNDDDRSAPVELVEVDAGAPEAQRAMGAYFAELDTRFRDGFDPGAGGADRDVAAMRPPAGAFVVIRAGDETVGCGGLQRIDDETAEIKRMWIHPDWRGVGLGRRLLAELERIAADRGRARVVLDTNEVLTQAVAMYERAGYVAIERYNDNPYAHHWFAKRLSADGGRGPHP